MSRKRKPVHFRLFGRVLCNEPSEKKKVTENPYSVTCLSCKRAARERIREIDAPSEDMVGVAYG